MVLQYVKYKKQSGKSKILANTKLIDHTMNSPFNPFTKVSILANFVLDNNKALHKIKK